MLGLLKNKAEQAGSPNSHRDRQEADDGDNGPQNATQGDEPDIDQSQPQNDTRDTSKGALHEIDKTVHRNLL